MKTKVLLANLFVSTTLLACLHTAALAADYDFPESAPLKIELHGQWKYKADPDETGLDNGYQLVEADDSEWKSLEVPAPWSKTAPDLKDYDGGVWHRTTFQVPSEWEDVELVLDLGKVDDAAHVYINGEFIGRSHHFEDSNRHVVPSGVIKTGEENTIAVLVEDFTGEGGIAPGPVTLEAIYPWSEIAIGVEWGDHDYVFREGSPVSFTMSITNPLEGGFPGTVEMAIEDIDGKSVYDESFSMRFETGDANELQVDLEELPLGFYDGSVMVSSNGLELREGAFTFVVLGEPIEFADPDAAPFAISGGALFHIPMEVHPTQGRMRMRQMQKLGAPWARCSVWWDRIYRGMGEYDWKKADNIISLYEEHDLRLLGIVNSSGDALAGRPPTTEHAREVFCDYLEKVVTRYKGRVPAWEIWNEPNLPHFWQFTPDPYEYAPFMSMVAETIRKADPDTKIMGVVTSGVPMDYIAAVLDTAGTENLDGIAVHPYQGPFAGEGKETDSIPKLKELREYLDGLDPELEIWLTECGWPTIGTLDEKQQSAAIVRYYAKTLGDGYADKVYWFNLDDWGPRGSSTGGHFGLTYMDHTPKPSYLAYYTMMDHLANYDEASPWETSSDSVKAYLFESQLRRVIVAWAIEENETMEIPAGFKTMTDVWGRRLPRSEEITLTGEPVYLIEEKK